MEMNMKKYLLLMLVVLTGVFSSCKYDDDELWGSVDELANRVSAVEALTKQMNGDMAAIQAIITALENEVSVTDVEMSTEGYVLHFSNGEKATILNGKDGKDAPFIGIEKENGVYFWTLTVDGITDWLKDEQGTPLSVTHGNGNTGANGRTPTLGVDEEGYWIASYDGKNYNRIKGADGKDIYALGATYENMFKNVEVGTETITIEMKDGKQYKLPLVKCIEFFMDAAHEVAADIKNLEWSGTSEFVLYYQLEMDSPSFEWLAEEGLEVLVDLENSKVTLKLLSDAVSDSRGILLFFNEIRTVTSVFKFKVAPWNSEVKEVTPDAQGVYQIVTPAHLAWIAQQVNEGNAFTGKTIRLVNNIDLAGLPWMPIGTDSNHPFSGTFDGNNKQIKGLSVTDLTLQSKAFSRNESTQQVKGAGLFGVVKGATLSNVTIKDAMVNPTEATTGAGVLVGCALDEVTIEGVTIDKETPAAETPTVNVQGSQNVGSVAGYISASNVKIANCEVKSTSLAATQDETGNKEESVGGVIGMLEVTQTEGSATAVPSVEISGCKVDGIDLSSSSSNTEAGGSESANSTSMGGVVGSLKVDEALQNSGTSIAEIIQVKDNNVANAQVNNAPAETEKETTSQGAVVGNLSELVEQNQDLSASIMKDNQVDETVKIENQLTVNNLQAMINATITEGAVQTFDVKGDSEGAMTLTIPSNNIQSAQVTLNFATLTTAANKKLTVEQGTGNVAGEAKYLLTINMPYEGSGHYLDIKAPQSTVTLKTGAYAKVTSLTAENSLYVDGATIEDLHIADGMVHVTANGKITGEITTASAEIVYVVLEDGATVAANLPGVTLGENVVLVNNLTFDLIVKAKKGGSYQLTARTHLDSPLIVENDLVLDMNGQIMGCSNNIKDFLDNRNLKTIIAVKPGATLTINDSKGGAQLNTGQREELLSCIRLLGEGSGKAKVIINGGWIVGTYYGIVVEADCADSEIVVNGGHVHGDFNCAFNGLGIFNPAAATVTIAGGTVQGHGSAIEMRGGALTVSGGQLIAEQTELKTGEQVNPTVGNTILGPAVAISPLADVEVNITGGTFENKGYAALYEKVMGEGEQPAISMNITGGTFLKGVWSEDCTHFIKGGLFKVKPEAQLVEQGKVMVLNNGYYTVQVGVDEGNTGGSNFGDGGDF